MDVIGAARGEKDRGARSENYGGLKWGEKGGIVLIKYLGRSEAGQSWYASMKYYKYYWMYGGDRRSAQGMSELLWGDSHLEPLL